MTIREAIDARIERAIELDEDAQPVITDLVRLLADAIDQLRSEAPWREAKPE